MKLFDRFDKVYCVNLDKRPDRLENFKNQVEKYDLGNFEIFKAIDGKNLDMSEFKTKLRPGELGLILTIINIVKICKSNNYENVLIVEDDCEFNNEINFIDSYFEKLPSDWDMTFLHDGCNMHASNIRPDIIWYKEIYSRTVCSYMLTLETAKKIVETLLPIDDHPYIAIDNCLNEEIQKHNLNVYWCEPVIIKEGSQNNFYNSTYVRLS